MSVILRDISVDYGRTRAVDRVSLTARAGEVTALVGANGSGKSSLLKATAGLVRCGGAITLPTHAGTDRPIGYMPQDTASGAALTVIEVVLLGRYRQLGLRLADTDMQAAVQALASLGIEHLSGRYLGELSGGQRQLVFLAQVLANRPRVLLLDEPISALDIHHQLHVLETIRHLTVTQDLVTIVVLHDLTAAARHADRIAIMANGRIAGDGTPAEVLTESLIRQVFHVDVAVHEGPGGKLAITALRCAHDP